jgi:outer membrane protein assembly factor BamB
MPKARLTFLVITLAFVLGSVISANAQSRWLIDESRLNATDVKIDWQFNLPMSDRESTGLMKITGNRLFELSNRNFLTCFNRTDGNVIFSNFIEEERLPYKGLEYYKGLLLTLVGKKVVEVNTDFGVTKSFQISGYGVTSNVVRNDSFYYFAGLDNRLHALKENDKVQAFEAAAENDSTITSILAEEDTVIFATDAGNVICIVAEGPKRLWQFDCPKAVAGQVIHDGNLLYIACKDTKIYCIEAATGHLTWSYQTQGILNEAPQAGKMALYQYVPDAGVVALDKKTGKFIWQVKDGVGFLSEYGDKTFVLTKSGVITAMDNVKRKQLYTIDLGQALKFSSNLIDSKIYVCDDKGRFACIEPIR